MIKSPATEPRPNVCRPELVSSAAATAEKAFPLDDSEFSDF